MIKVNQHITSKGTIADRVEMPDLLRLINKAVGVPDGTYASVLIPNGGAYALLFKPKASAKPEPTRASSAATTLSASGRALLKALNNATDATLAQKSAVLARNLKAGAITKADHDLIASALRLADSVAPEMIILEGLEKPKPKRQRKSA
jgi:hypothetical protein